MHINMPYKDGQIEIEAPEDAIVYQTRYQSFPGNTNDLVRNALRNPVESFPLASLIKRAAAESVVVVVSDVTRPIPYADFLEVVLEEIELAGVPGNAITILIATGMHRRSTPAEREHMFGLQVCERYRIVDHHAEKADELETITGKSRAGRAIQLNRVFVEADFRVITGLVEPHFMAGFSGGRKAVCPGLCSLETVKAFHSFDFLNHPGSRNGNLEGNPLHDEALSIARQAQIGFSIHIIVDKNHRVVDVVAGDLEVSHELACRLVREQACPPVAHETDVVITSSGGHPLDATFYQCVKGMCSCLPAVKKGGIVVAVGSCSEGIGGIEYQSTMQRYAGRWKEFLKFIQSNPDTMKDQWQLQMQTKVLQHVGEKNLIFVTDGLEALELRRLGVNGIYAPASKVQETVQELVNNFVRESRSITVIPEGPYCAPIAIRR
ncbi:MAG: nickel-dependent lactate racemase [Calditrichaeota bacterium]|nr:MAG: nickel-dependent lactate racemase [Calditrichota bacterium]